MAKPPTEYDDKSIELHSHDGDRLAQHSEESLARRQEPEEFNPGWRFYLAFLSLTTITLMVALDATSLSVALPIIAQKLNGTAIQAFWSGTSFLLTSTVFQPVIGSFSSIFGRKAMIYVSLVFFAAGAIVAAVANNFTIILIGRSIQGVGGGGILALTEVLITDMVPLKYRGNWFSFLSGAWAVGTVTGPLLGGGFSQKVNWRWIFWVNLPFVGLGAVLIILFLRLNYHNTAFWSKLCRVDWIGTTLFIASLTGFLVPLSWGGVMYDWMSWRTLVPLITCGIGLIVFVVYEEWLSSTGAEPLIQFEVIKTRTGSVTYFATFIHGLLLWCLLYYMPFYYEAVKGFTPILAGVSLFPQTFTVAPASVVTGVVAAMLGRYRWAVWSGWFLTTVGMGILIFLDINTTTPTWICLNIVGGVGCGFLFAAMSLAVQASSSNKNMAYAVILFAFFRSFGQTVGVAIGGVVFQNVLRRKLEAIPYFAPRALEYSKDSSALVQIIKHMPASLEKTQLLESYMAALRAIFIMCTALAAVAMVSSAWTEGFPLDRELETDQGFQHQARKSDEELRPTTTASKTSK
ncbi:putative MFS transporter [Microthyrium microscopicum]|uniref:Putative MFS transporter n=1 Tax=Microthyrium microscopicum TaxID=703497 RepID=A0A6A6US05_9PEZI|nr:putative MFS transporter [Microthyrium microscopicum]